MAGDRNDVDDRTPLLPLDLVRAVMREDSKCAGGVVLRVGLKCLFALGAGERGRLVRLEAWMVRVDFQKSQGLANLLQECGL